MTFNIHLFSPKNLTACKKYLKEIGIKELKIDTFNVIYGSSETISNRHQYTRSMNMLSYNTFPYDWYLINNQNETIFKKLETFQSAPMLKSRNDLSFEKLKGLNYYLVKIYA